MQSLSQEKSELVVIVGSESRKIWKQQRFQQREVKNDRRQIERTNRSKWYTVWVHARQVSNGTDFYAEADDGKVLKEEDENACSVCGKAYDRVPRSVVWEVLKKKGVDETYVRIVKDMYEGVTTKIKTRTGVSDSFEVKIDVDQGSA